MIMNINCLSCHDRVKVSATLAIARMTGSSKNTISKLLLEVGAACADYQNRIFRYLNHKRIQCDEIWSFVGAKNKNVPESRKDEFGFGSVWTWRAIDAEIKLVLCWMVGPRDVAAATEFMQDLASRLACRVQLATDGHKAYLDAVEDAFGSDIDYATLIKLYGQENLRRNPPLQPR